MYGYDFRAACLCFVPILIDKYFKLQEIGSFINLNKTSKESNRFAVIGGG